MSENCKKRPPVKQKEEVAGDATRATSQAAEGALYDNYIITQPPIQLNL